MTTNESDFLHYLKTGDMDLTENYGIPKIKGVKFKNLNSVDVLGFNYSTKVDCLKECNDRYIHFFLPDYCIERVWNNPDKYAPVFGVYRGIVQPDFSQYMNMPKAMKIWQHYRRMWLTAYYQKQGIRVIPAPCWSDEESFEYCFEGMPKGSCLCISTVGCMQNKAARAAFNVGFKETLERLEPSQLIFYGKIDEGIKDLVKVPYTQIDSDMKRRISVYEEKLLQKGA